ncbi:MAG: chromosomal replication initiator protein DnaA [Candidatus Omnitrophota bacterium]|nr:chromosomal replication initiator protein DnaA [Candidatus Omnitrophota bacterium]
MKPLDIWAKSKNLIQEKIGESAFGSWFSSINAKEKNSHSLILEAPDDFFKNWLVEHYLNLILDSLKTVSGGDIQVEFSVNPAILEKVLQSQSKEPASTLNDKTIKIESLNPRFTFEAFVVGPSNRFAHAASLAVAESPAKAYNPLFIYGGVGLGKTHLMQAVAHHIQHKDPNIKNCYMTSERFTNELIDAIQHRTTAKFRQKYRNIDCLMIDDIHFIAGKESTQEEFFHTFNVLFDNHKQIIISSDRPPKEIAKLEERLSSRFSWGLITDIQPPDLETRIAILRKKVEREPIKVPDEVLNFIAQEIKSNIRELEGALIRVVAYSLLEEKEVSLGLAQEVLKDLVKESQRKITIDAIQKHVTDFFGVGLQDMKTKRRNKNIVLPRQIAMYLARELTNLSLPEIGAGFGGKDHTTVLHSWNKIKNGLNKDAQLKDCVEKITREIKY